MTKQEASAFLTSYMEKLSAYQCALSIMNFDQSTVAPKDGAPYRNKCVAILSGELFSHLTDPDAIAKLEAIVKMEDSDALDLINAKLLLKDLEELRFLPKPFYVAYQNCVGDASSAWEEAKKQNDYALFEPHLQKVITMLKESLSYLHSEKSDYEVLLDRFQPGMSMEAYDEFFALIKSRLLPFIKRLQKEGKPIDDTILHQHYDSAVQEQVMHDLQAYLHYDPRKIYMGVTMHPFTSKICADDTRLSTAYVEDNLVSSIFSIIHEYGHALYGMQVDRAYDGMPAGDSLSLGMHESQSRLLENNIGRRRAFWESNFPQLKNRFPEQLEALTLDDFIKLLHVSKPSLIRTEADELTYPIHILIRYELEKMIFNEDLPLEHLDKVWADKYEEYLGIRPSKPAEGILQDMHWANGMFGYFPTYALGSAFAAQFFAQMQKDIHVDEALKKGDFNIIMDWLKEHIHRYGATKTPEEIMMAVCGKPFDPNCYIDYLIETYSAYYGLDR